MPKTITTAAIAIAALMLVASPASAKKPQRQLAQSFSYIATIDCGKGPIQVGSGDDLWSPFVDLKSGKVVQPIAWHVAFGDERLDENMVGAPNKHATVCSYTDGYATGTVTVTKGRPGAAARRGQ
jgi:hypothetical protein